MKADTKKRLFMGGIVILALALYDKVIKNRLPNY